MVSTVAAPGRAGRTPAWDRPVRLTALHREHVALGASLAERDGWLLPASYGNAEKEAAATREAVGVIDIGESGKIDVKSDDVGAALGAAFPGLQAPAIGQTARSGETTVYRLTAGQALVVAPATAAAAALEGLERAAASLDCTHVTDLTSALCGVRLLGPKAPALLELLTPVDLAPDRFADGSLVQAGVAHAHAIVARRDSGGVIGYDLYVDRDLGSYLWTCLMEQGAPLGITPVGRDVAISHQ